MELTKEFKRKSDGLSFVQYGNDNYIYCLDDDSGEKDIKVTPDELNKNYEFVKSYVED